jgi:hypothetical protein
MFEVHGPHILVLVLHAIPWSHSDVRVQGPQTPAMQANPVEAPAAHWAPVVQGPQAPAEQTSPEGQSALVMHPEQWPELQNSPGLQSADVWHSEQAPCTQTCPFGQSAEPMHSPQTPEMQALPALQSEACVHGLQRLPEHTPERQSVAALQATLFAQGPQTGPPQSTPVSSPSFFLSVQLDDFVVQDAVATARLTVRARNVPKGRIRIACFLTFCTLPSAQRSVPDEARELGTASLSRPFRGK